MNTFADYRIYEGCFGKMEKKVICWNNFYVAEMGIVKYASKLQCKLSIRIAFGVDLAKWKMPSHCCSNMTFIDEYVLDLRRRRVITTIPDHDICVSWNFLGGVVNHPFYTELGAKPNVCQDNV